MGNDQVQFAKIQRSVFADWPCLGVLQVVAVVRKVTMEAASWNTAKFARSSNYNQRGREASLEERSTITYTHTRSRLTSARVVQSKLCFRVH